MGAILGFSGPPDPALFQRMSAAIAHRGVFGVSYQESPLATVGYRAQHEKRLRECLGAGFLCRNGITLALAGFLTNREALFPVLPTLLDLYASEGLEFVKRLRGAFVLAIQDGSRLHLVRDGAGARTVYYGLHEGRLFFSVEPKGVLAVPGFLRRIRPAGVARFLTFSFQPGSETLLEDLFELPAGHILTWDNNLKAPHLTDYFWQPRKSNGTLSDQEWTERFAQTFGQAVEERMPPGEAPAIFLSGGIDSSVVTAEAAKQYAGRLKTYAIHFGEEYPNELEFARSVAERCGTDHHEVLIRPKHFLPNLREIIWRLDDPIGDPVTMPNYELSRRVSKETRWVFNGEGGDPCFGGPKNLPMMLHHWYGGVPRDERFRELHYLASYRRSFEELHRLLDPDFMRQIDVERDLSGILTPFFTDNGNHLLRKLTTMNMRLKGAHLILPKVERMTAASGITPLSPLFDERLIDLSLTMPPRLIVSNGVEKVVLKRAYADALPAEVIARPKSGMRVPVHWWFQGEMKRYARSILHPKRLRREGIFNAERVRQLLRYDTEEGPGRYGLRIWMLLVFEIWRRIVIEGEAP